MNRQRSLKFDFKTTTIYVRTVCIHVIPDLIRNLVKDTNQLLVTRFRVKPGMTYKNVIKTSYVY